MKSSWAVVTCSSTTAVTAPDTFVLLKKSIALTATRSLRAIAPGSLCQSTMSRSDLGDKGLKSANKDDDVVVMTFLTGLFYSHRLRQVPGLVDIAAATHGDVIRQELERNDRKDGRQQIA